MVGFDCGGCHFLAVSFLFGRLWWTRGVILRLIGLKV